MQLPPALALPPRSPLQGGFYLAEAVSQAVRAGVGSGEGWSGLWKVPVHSRLTGEHVTQERSHIPAEKVWRGLGSSAAARPQPQGCAWPDPPSHPLAPTGLRTESPRAGGTRRFGGIQQEVLQGAGQLCPSRGSSVPTCGAECRDSADNTTLGTPRLAGGSASPYPMALLSRLVPGHPETPATHPSIHAAALAGAGAHGQSVPCPVSHGAGRHRAPAAPMAFPWEKRPRCRGATGPGPPAPARAGN